MPKSESLHLRGDNIQLESFSEKHKNELFQSAQNPIIWQAMGVSLLDDNFEAWFDKSMSEFEGSTQIPFVVRRRADDQLIGSTRFYDIQPSHASLSIGYTWYIPEVWGTYVNPEAKLLLLQHAFEALNLNRVQLKTDMKNLRSRAAIKKLGAKEEGVLRQHMILDRGVIRDTVIFSIIKPEWPVVKANLQRRLEEYLEA